MKKLTRTLFAMLVALASSVSAFAYDFKFDDMYFNVLSEKNLTCEIAGCEFSGNPIFEIPSSVEYNGNMYSVVSIASNAFSKCDLWVQMVIIPNSVTSIGDCAFGYCNIKSVIIPSSVEKIGVNPFEGCSIPDFLIEKNDNFYIEDGCLISKDGLLISGNGAYGDLEISNKVKAIGDYAFRHGQLFSVTIPNSVNTIGIYAFDNCLSMSEVKLPNTLKKIESNSFSWCRIKNIEIPNSVVEIGHYAFEGCTELSTVVIPNSVEKIGYEAFAETALENLVLPKSVIWIGSLAFHCRNLKEITSLNSNPPSILINTFNNFNKNVCVLKVPAESVELYRAADYWKEFFNIVAIEETTGINSFGSGATLGKTYGINGAIVGEGCKGIVIRDGKKFVVK